jgi:hypothetical protein
MSLTIEQKKTKNKEQIHNLFIDRDEIYVYVLLEKRQLGQNFYISEQIDNSPQNFWNLYKQKVFEIDRPTDPTKGELESSKFNGGFHTFPYLRELLLLSMGKLDQPIARFKASEKDIIAVSHINNHHPTTIKFNNSIYKQLKPDQYTKVICRKLEFVSFFE